MIIYLCFRNVETVGLKIHLPEGNVLLVGVNLKKKNMNENTPLRQMSLIQ